MKENYSGPFVTLAIIGLLIVIAGGVWYVHPANRVAAPPAAAPTQTQTQTQAAAQPGPVLPSFDAFHVGPDGGAVIAGRAAPGAKVTVLEHGTPIGNATADANGEWVIMTARPLSPGAQELSLSAQTPGAATPQKSATTLAVIVPENAAQPPVAVALPQGEGGAARPMGALGARAPRHVALDMVEYDASGKTILSGRADPGASVEIFIGKQAVGTVTPAADGGWSLALEAGVPIGLYHLRLVSRGADGKQEETALDLRRASPGELGGGDYLAVVPGNNLWHLARRSYGDGLRYVEIYRANRSEIADPNLIYPNQLLSLPGKS
jgi:nucleoid-associated protein YgaU